MKRRFQAFSGSLPFLLVLLILSGCGDDDEPSGGASSSSAPPESSESSTSAAAVPDLPDAAAAEAAVQAYFDAMRTGDTATICALETPELQTSKYGDPSGCAENASNLMEQPVWAEDVVIVDAAVDASPAYLTVRPNAGGGDAETLVTLQAVDGEWLVAGFS